MPGKSRGPRSLGATVHGVSKNQTWLSNFTSLQNRQWFFFRRGKSHGNRNTKLEHLPNQGSQTLKCPLPDSVNRLILTQTPKNENLWQMCTWSCRLACAWPEVVSGAWYYKWRTERATVYPKLEAKTVFGKYRMEKIYIAMVTNYFYTHIKQK